MWKFDNMKVKKEKLYNLYTNAELKQQLYAETFTRTTVSFYHYFVVEDPRELRDEMYKKLFEL